MFYSKTLKSITAEGTKIYEETIPVAKIIHPVFTSAKHPISKMLVKLTSLQAAFFQANIADHEYCIATGETECLAKLKELLQMLDKTI